MQIFTFIKNFLNHTFKIDSNPQDAKVIYIVDAYDRNKDIVCTTPCKMTLPWEPIRKKPSKKRVLIEKDGYKTKVVELKTPKKVFIYMLIIAFLFGILGGYLNIEPLLIIVFIIFILSNISIGSEDLNITLEKEDNK